MIQDCVTKGGPDPNKPCVFPFNDRGISYNKCTSGTSGGKPWCPTEVDKNGYYLTGKWGECGSNCGTSNTSFVSLFLLTLFFFLGPKNVKICGFCADFFQGF